MQQNLKTSRAHQIKVTDAGAQLDHLDWKPSRSGSTDIAAIEAIHAYTAPGDEVRHLGRLLHIQIHAAKAATAHQVNVTDAGAQLGDCGWDPRRSGSTDIAASEVLDARTGPE